nr:glycosyltransferase family 4 protein [Micromonospora sp. DSM 115978]
MIPNGVDLDRFDPTSPADEGIRRRLGARPGDTLVVSLGAHGISQGLTSVAAAAEQHAGEPVHISFVGEGAAKRALADRVAAVGLTNVTLLPAVGRDEVADVLAAADVCLVPLRAVPLFDTFVPSKMFEILAAGRPVIGSVRGEAAAILVAAGAAVVPPEDPTALAEAIKELAADPRRRDRMARAGRTYVETHYDRTVLARRYRDVVLKVLGRVPENTTAAVRLPVPR